MIINIRELSEKFKKLVNEKIIQSLVQNVISMKIGNDQCIIPA
jgi:hypothetical protein